MLTGVVVLNEANTYLINRDTFRLRQSSLFALIHSQPDFGPSTRNGLECEVDPEHGLKATM